MKKKSSTKTNIPVSVWLLIALVIGILIGTSMVGNRTQSASEAVEVGGYTQVAPAPIQGSGGAQTQGKSCYEKCREDGNPRAICFFGCL